MPKWKGNWIWCSGDESPRNFYVYMRKVVDLPAKAGRVQAGVCADSRYKLFVNGKLVGRGPVRSFPQFQHYDEYDFSKLLKKGKNTIAALVHHFGENTFQYHLGRGAFLFDAELEVNGAKTSIVSDESWKVLPSQAWYQNLPRMSIQLGFQEIHDMNKAPEGWTEPGFDDSAWESAKVVGPVGTPPWKLIPRDIPYLPEFRIHPANVLETGAADASAVELADDDRMNISFIQGFEKREKGVKKLFANAKSFVRLPQITDLMDSDLMKPDGEPAKLMAARCEEANASLEDVVVNPSPDGRSSYVVLDFGREVMGYVNLRIKSNSGGIVDLGYSEILDSGICNAHRNGLRYADRVVLRPGEAQYETFDKRGFRYMQLDFRELGGPVTIESVGLGFSTYPVKWRGSFACSDDLLNDIWNVSVYTVQLNMEDAYTDCPWRERAAWMGDARVEALVNYYSFGDTALARQMWREIARSQHEDGITNCFAPGDLGPCTPIPSFCLIWILSIWDYYLYTGDKDLVAELYPNVKKALKWFAGYTNDMGLASHLPYWMFIDWADVDIRGAVTSLNCFLAGALNDAAKMAKLIGKDDEAKKHSAAAAKLTTAINRHLFDAERGVYVDCHCDGEPSGVVSEQSNSVAVVFGVAPREAWPRLLDYIHSPENQVVRAGSPYFSFYVLQALWQAGRKERALEYIRGKWGDMLAKGATTCWEQWNQDHSLCHGWSGGPGMDLPAEILGIRPLSPGFRKFQVAPEPFGLEWAEGAVPTPRGLIEVHWKRGNGFALSVTAPKGTTAVVRLPEAIDPGKVKVNGRKKLPEGIRTLASVDGRPVFSVKGPGAVEFSFE